MALHAYLWSASLGSAAAFGNFWDRNNRVSFFDIEKISIQAWSLLRRGIFSCFTMAYIYNQAGNTGIRRYVLSCLNFLFDCNRANVPRKNKKFIVDFIRSFSGGRHYDKIFNGRHFPSNFLLGHKEKMV